DAIHRQHRKRKQHSLAEVRNRKHVPDGFKEVLDHRSQLPRRCTLLLDSLIDPPILPSPVGTHLTRASTHVVVTRVSLLDRSLLARLVRPLFRWHTLPRRFLRDRATDEVPLAAGPLYLVASALCKAVSGDLQRAIQIFSAAQDHDSRRATQMRLLDQTRFGHRI